MSKMVNVKLKARCLVNGQIREEGEIVDLPEKAPDAYGRGMHPYAETFGEIVKLKKGDKADVEAENAEIVADAKAAEAAEAEEALRRETAEKKK